MMSVTLPQILGVDSTDLFIGTSANPLQVVRVRVSNAANSILKVTTIAGHELGQAPISADREHLIDVGLKLPAGAKPGQVLKVRASLIRLGTVQSTATGTVTVESSNWTMYFINFFHFDAVWWNTQAALTSNWDAEPTKKANGNPMFAESGLSAFSLVKKHLDLAIAQPDYRFLLSEIDYLKPYWDTHVEQRTILRRLIDRGQIELVGGTYNEPITNLISCELVIRNIIYGSGFQRSVIGGDPQTAWQLDVFGHDPQFAGLAASAGLTSSAFARGPFHQWGPMMRDVHNGRDRSPEVMNMPSEFEWISPSGNGVLTHYMPAHYSAGWPMDSANSLADAEQQVIDLFHDLKTVATTHNIMLPVGTDYTPPNRWVLQIQRDWNSRYTSPRLISALPRDFYAAVRAEMTDRHVVARPETRDMNPIYTGKDVSYIGIKQAHRAAENLLADCEKFATILSMLGEAYPANAIDKAWRQLCYRTHHDALTGSGGDQVYIDLLAGWREAYELAKSTYTRALERLAARVDTSVRSSGAGQQTAAVIVANPLNWSRSDIVRATIPWTGADEPVTLIDNEGHTHSAVLVCRSKDSSGNEFATVDVVVHDVPGVGYKTLGVVDAACASQGIREWEAAIGTTIANEYFTVSVDPARGGCISSLLDNRSGREAISKGRWANEIRVYDEYTNHPDFGEGPWHLLPTGTSTGSSTSAAHVQRFVSGAGHRLEITGEVRGIAYTQTITCWSGIERVDIVTRLGGFSGSDQLIRIAFPADVRGALPVSEVGAAVIGRGFGFPDVDTALHPRTLDNPAFTWFGLTSTARITLRAAETGVTLQRAIGVAEIIAPDDLESTRAAREFAVSLARVGVTSTLTSSTGNRYGDLDVDSNLPDVRFALACSLNDEFVSAVLDAAGPQYRAEVELQLAGRGSCIVYIPASSGLRNVWVPSANVTQIDALPVILVVGTDRAATINALRHVAADMADSDLCITQPAELLRADSISADRLENYTVAMLNRGTPSFVVSTEGTLFQSVMRSCKGWPSGVWVDGPRRTAPDGSSFSLQHWTHTFEYAFVGAAGDWREAGIESAGQGFNHPLTPYVTGVHAGRLPGSFNLIRVDAKRDAVLSALKPLGNSSAEGISTPPAVANGLVFRLFDASGFGTPVKLSTWAPLISGGKANILERDHAPIEGDGATLNLELHGSEIATVIAAADLDRIHEPQPMSVRDCELIQPVFSNYWLHNTGAAPMGNMPIALSFTQRSVNVEGPTAISLSIASDIVDLTQRGVIQVTPPKGWSASPSQLPFTLAPGAFDKFDITVTPPLSATPGIWFLTAGTNDVVSGQQVEDAVALHVTAQNGVLPEGDVDVKWLVDRISLAAGRTSVARLEVSNSMRSQVHGQLYIISPFEAWSFCADLAHPFEVDAGRRIEVCVPIQCPASVAKSSTWALAKVMWFGHVAYAEAIPIEVEAAPGRFQWQS